MKKIAILTILMLAIAGLMNGCAHHQTLQRCQERHGQPAKVVQGEGDMVTWYYYHPGRRGYTTVMEVVGNTTTGVIHQIKKYPSAQNAGLSEDTKQPSPPSEGTLKRKAPTTKQSAPSDARAKPPSEQKASLTTPNVPSPVRAGLPSVVSPPSGFYSLDTLIDFDTLDEVTYNPIKGTLSLSGRRMHSNRQVDLHYLNLLADALDSDKPVFSLEWTPSSQREVDRAFAYFSDDRNNEEITTKLSKIFDANGRLNRKGALFFKALGANVREGMDRYEFNASLLTAAGHEKAGAVLKPFGAMVEAIKRDDSPGRDKSFEDLAGALGLYDFIANTAAKYRAGQITQKELVDTVYPRLLDELAKAFGWNGTRYVEKYRSLRRAGRSFEDAGNEALWDFQNDLNTLPRKMIDTLSARVSEILVPSDIMKELLAAEPRVRPVLTGLPEKSQLARVAFEADVFCKSLFNMPDLKAKVPKYQTYFEWRRTKRQRPMPEDGHLWISPGDFEIFESADGQTLRFGRTPMRINIEKYLAGKISAPDPQLSEYASLLTACYDDIAREYAVLHQLRECTKMVAVAQWLKKRGYSVSMPIAGRERVNLPAEVPGVIYMVMAIKQASVGQILTAAGGVDFSGDSDRRYIRREMQSPQSDFVEVTIQQTKEKVEKIFNKKIDIPVPRPLGSVTTENTGGRKVTTVTISTASSTSGTSSFRLRRNQEEQAAFLWKSDDLDKGEQAYRKLIESCSDDVRYCASLRMVLAQVLHEKGDNATAIKELKEAVRIAPDLPLIQLLYAKMLFDNGDLRGAEEALQKYLSLDPSNKAAAKILTEVQARQKRPTTVTSMTSTPVPLTPFNQALGQVPTSVLGDSRAPELRDIRIEPFKASGRDQPRPVQVPKKLAETEGWKKLKAEDDKLTKDYMEIDRKLEEIRNKKGRGEGNQNELDKQESQLRQEQATMKEKIDTFEKEMVGVLVKWEKENPEPPASESVQPVGNEPSLPKEGEKKP